MPDSFVIKPFLTAHLAEAKGMLETEYDEQKAMELFRIEGWNEGHTEGWNKGLTAGREEGILNTITAYRECGMDDNTIVSRIMEKFDISAELARKYISQAAEYTLQSNQ